MFDARPIDFPDDQTMITTALSYMEGGTAGVWKTSILRNAWVTNAAGRRQGYGTWQNFLNNLQVTFAPINEAFAAANQLRMLGKKEFDSIDDLNGEFIHLIRKSGITDPQAQLGWYQQALPPVIRDKIMGLLPAPPDLEGWMGRAVDSDRNWKLKKELNKALDRKPKNRMKTVKATRVNTLSAEEQKELMEKGLCFHCKKRGHISRFCPNKRKGKSQQKIREVTREDEGADEEESDGEIQVNAARIDDDEQDF